MKRECDERNVAILLGSLCAWLASFCFLVAFFSDWCGLNGGHSLFLDDCRGTDAGLDCQSTVKVVWTQKKQRPRRPGCPGGKFQTIQKLNPRISSELSSTHTNTQILPIKIVLESDCETCKSIFVLCCSWNTNHIHP